MDTKRVALVAVFAALAIILSPSISRISIPSPFFGLPYQVWEIPIFVAFLMFGPKLGLLVAGVGSVVLVALQPMWVVAAGVLACFAMLGGFYLAYKLVTRNVAKGTTPSTRKTVIAITAGAIIFRTLVMAVQNYYMLQLMYPSMTQSFLVSVAIPLVALFNATEPLYVIPVSYFVAKGIGSSLKIGNKI